MAWRMPAQYSHMYQRMHDPDLLAHRMQSTHEHVLVLLQANHVRDCPHYISQYDYVDYVDIIAGADVQPGDEVGDQCLF